MALPTITYEQYKRAVQLGTREGFLLAYWNALPKHKTQTDAFNAINDEHFDHFEEYKYNSYDTFRKVMYAAIKSKR